MNEIELAELVDELERRSEPGIATLHASVDLTPIEARLATEELERRGVDAQVYAATAGELREYALKVAGRLKFVRRLDDVDATPDDPVGCE